MGFNLFKSVVYTIRKNHIIANKLNSYNVNYYILMLSKITF